MMISFATIITSMLMCFVPLIGLLGYESGAAAGLYMAIVGAFIGRRAASAGNSSTIDAAISVFAPPLLHCLTMFFILFVHTHLIRGCNAIGGASVFLAICVPTALNFSAAGYLFGAVTRRKSRFLFMMAAYFLTWCGVSAWQFLAGPRIVVWNGPLGLISSSGFNGAALLLDSCFYTARLWFLSIAIVLFLIGFIRVRGKSCRFVSTMTSLTTVGLCLAVAIAALIFPEWCGVGLGRNKLREALSSRVETRHFVIHYSPDGLSRDERKIAALQHEWYYGEIQRLLRTKDKRKIHSYVFASPKQQGEITGAEDFFFTAPWRRELFVEKKSLRTSLLKHELAHVMLSESNRSLLRMPWNIGLIEGAATAVEKNLWRDDPFQKPFAAAMRAKTIVAGTKSMRLSGFGSGAMYRSYDMAGAFCGFLIHRYGAGNFLELYSGRSFNEVYEKTARELDAEWKRYLEGISVDDELIRFAKEIYSDKSAGAFYDTKCGRLGERRVFFGGKSCPDKMRKDGWKRPNQINENNTVWNFQLRGRTYLWAFKFDEARREFKRMRRECGDDACRIVAADELRRADYFESGK